MIDPRTPQTPEPVREPFDPHLGPLDDDDDARWLSDDDPRRVALEHRHGRRWPRLFDRRDAD
jgi:hypothetical protein